MGHCSAPSGTEALLVLWSVLAQAGGICLYSHLAPKRSQGTSYTGRCLQPRPGLHLVSGGAGLGCSAHSFQSSPATASALGLWWPGLDTTLGARVEG